MVSDLADLLGPDRDAAICRELTKRFEEVRRGTLRDLADALASTEPRGEHVVVVGRGRPPEVDDDAVRHALREARATMRMKDAATAVAGALGLPRRQVYQIALGLEAHDGAE